MDLFWEGIREGLHLIFSGDREVYEIAFFSLGVSGAATAIATAIGLTVASVLAFRALPGRTIALSIMNSGMALPPVVVGLVVAVMFFRTGPLGRLGLLYTPPAIVIAQAIIATPVVTALSAAALQAIHPKLRLQVLALGASRWQAAWLLFREARLALLAAVMAGFGAAISEVGATIMVGGNIKGYTRTLTSATVLAVSRGDFEMAFALSFILLLLIYVVAFTLTVAQQRRRAS